MAEATFDWKNHPVIIASGTAVATLLFATAIFVQIILPTQTAKLDAEVAKYKDVKEKAEEATKKAEEMSKVLEVKVSSLEAKISSLELRIKNLGSEKGLTEQQLIDSRAVNIFFPDNPYPNGLAVVKIGDQRDAIEVEYAKKSKKIETDDPEMVTVYLKDSPFERVVYYLTDATPKAKISHISFDFPLFGSKYSEDFLFKKIVENFGKPLIGRGGKGYMWTVGSAHSIFAFGKNEYILMPKGVVPLFWREK